MMIMKQMIFAKNISKERLLKTVKIVKKKVFWHVRLWTGNDRFARIPVMKLALPGASGFKDLNNLVRIKSASENG
mgnify:CR=1 FL=1